MNRSMFSAIFSVFVGKFGSVFLSIIITPVLVRLLGTGEYGDYAFVLSVLAISVILVNFGITDGVRKYVAEKHNDKLWEEAVVGFYTKFAVLTVGVAIGIILVLDVFGIVTRLVGATLSQYALVFCLMLVVNQFTKVARNALMGLGLERVSEPIIVLRRAAYGIGAIGLVLMGYGAFGALLGYVIGYAIAAVVMTYYLAQHLDWRTALGQPTDLLPTNEMVRYNTLTVILILCSTTLYHVDIVLIRLMVDDSTAGLYKGALVIAEFLWFVPMILQVVLVHETSELWSRGAVEEVSNLASRILRYTMLATSLPLIGLAFLADAFVPLYLGTEFAATVGPLLLLLPGVFGFAIAKPMYAIGQGKGRLKPLIIATGTAAVLNLVLNVVLIPHFGIWGAAAATSFSYGSMAVFHLVAARRVGFSPLRELRFARLATTATITGITIAATDSLLVSDLTRLIIVPIVGTAAFVLAAITSGAIDTSERAAIVKWINMNLRTVRGPE